MQSQVSYIALGLALVVAAPAANAQTMITRDGAVIAAPPSGTLIGQEPLVTAPSGTLVTQPETIRTVETVQTVRPARPARTSRTIVRRQIVTTRRTVERIIPAPVVVAPAVLAPRVVATYPQPLYDDYQQPLYDTVVPAPPAPLAATTVMDEPIVAPPVYAAPVATTVPTYRYVYEPDRILVIDPATNIAIQAIPR